MHQENNLQIAVCNYLRLQYPEVIFMSDIGSGMKMTIGQALRVKKLRSSRAMPDLFIAEKREGFCGLFIELKKEGENLFKADGKTFKTEHLQEQYLVLQQLVTRGYFACFAIGFEDAQQRIDWYMKLKAV